FLVFVDRSALVKPPSSGLRINKARRSPGRFCPALHLPLAAAPPLSYEHWIPRWPGAEKGQTRQRSYSSNCFYFWVCRLGAGVWPASFGRRQSAQWRGATAHAHVASLELHRDGLVQALLDAHPGLAHACPNIPAVDLIDLCVIPHGVVVRHLALFHVAQDRRQIVLFAQGPVSIGGVGRLHGQGLVPPRQVFFLQVRIGLLEGTRPGHPQPFHQAVLRRQKLALDAALGLGRQLRLIQTRCADVSRSPIRFTRGPARSSISSPTCIPGVKTESTSSARRASIWYRFRPVGPMWFRKTR